MPRKIPESCADLDLAAVEPELIRTGANVSAAANTLGVPVHDLRLMTRAVPRLLDAALEAEEQALDEAEATVREGLRSPDAMRRLAAAKHILRTSPAAARRRDLCAMAEAT